MNWLTSFCNHYNNESNYILKTLGTSGSDSMYIFIERNFSYVYIYIAGYGIEICNCEKNARNI